MPHTRIATSSDRERAALRALAETYPTRESAIAEIARLTAELELPKGTIHVVSDVHGEVDKLRHVLNNASGSLRPLVTELFDGRIDATERNELLNVVYYPAEVFAHLGLTRDGDVARRGAWVATTIRRQFAVIAALARDRSLAWAQTAFPPTLRGIFTELFVEALADAPRPIVASMLATLTSAGEDLAAVRWASRVIRRLAVDELVVAGDLGDRGPRIDGVIDLIAHHPRLTVTWGNHDVAWMGACLGQPALIATVLRISLRYRRLGQLEEGYGITMQPLEKLARDVYGDDPAERFRVRGEGLREADQMARMQKAASILQFKLESQTIARHPEYGMGDRDLLGRLDLEHGTVRIGDRDHPLRDTHLPTIDPRDPSALSPEEERCLDRLTASFLASDRLWEHMRLLDRVGHASIVRDGHAIFHGCLPLDASGEFLALEVDGEPTAGVPLLEAVERVVHRAFREKRTEDLDFLWYLWTGPVSPMFGKAEMTTFERLFVEDTATHHETKNPYFKAIHDPAFAKRMLEAFGLDPDQGLVVNGHVPVKVEKGERPLKDSGRVITIDGAFSEAYGDRGYTLIIDAAGTRLAEHHHFESIQEALETGADITPKIEEIRRTDRVRRVGDTERGAAIRAEIALLEDLVDAHDQNQLR